MILVLVLVLVMGLVLVLGLVLFLDLVVVFVGDQSWRLHKLMLKKCILLFTDGFAGGLLKIGLHVWTWASDMLWKESEQKWESPGRAFFPSRLSSLCRCAPRASCTLSTLKHSQSTPPDRQAQFMPHEKEEAGRPGRAATTPAEPQQAPKSASSQDAALPTLEALLTVPLPFIARHTHNKKYVLLLP